MPFTKLYLFRFPNTLDNCEIKTWNYKVSQDNIRKCFILEKEDEDDQILGSSRG